MAPSLGNRDRLKEFAGVIRGQLGASEGARRPWSDGPASGTVVKRIGEEGDRGVIHRLQGRPLRSAAASTRRVGSRLASWSRQRRGERRTLWRCLLKYGRPPDPCTDENTIFQTPRKEELAETLGAPEPTNIRPPPSRRRASRGSRLTPPQANPQSIRLHMLKRTLLPGAEAGIPAGHGQGSSRRAVAAVSSSSSA